MVKAEPFRDDQRLLFKVSLQMSTMCRNDFVLVEPVTKGYAVAHSSYFLLRLGGLPCAATSTVSRNSSTLSTNAEMVSCSGSNSGNFPMLAILPVHITFVAKTVATVTQADELSSGNGDHATDICSSRIQLQ